MLIACSYPVLLAHLCKWHIRVKDDFCMFFLDLDIVCRQLVEFYLKNDFVQIPKRRITDANFSFRL